MGDLWEAMRTDNHDSECITWPHDVQKRAKGPCENRFSSNYYTLKWSAYIYQQKLPWSFCSASNVFAWIIFWSLRAHLFLSLRREISWVCRRMCFSSRLVKSEYSSSWISKRLVWFNTYRLIKQRNNSVAVCAGREIDWSNERYSWRNSWNKKVPSSWINKMDPWR